MVKSPSSNYYKVFKQAGLKKNPLFSIVSSQIKSFHLGGIIASLILRVKSRIHREGMFVFSIQDCGPGAFSSLPKLFSQFHLTANILCTAFHKLAVYFYSRNTCFLIHESISVCSKVMAVIVSGWWDYRWLFFLLFDYVCCLVLLQLICITSEQRYNRSSSKEDSISLHQVNEAGSKIV